MPDLLSLGSIIRDYEDLDRLHRDYLSSTAITAQQVIYRSEIAYQLSILKQLAAEGFDEVLCFRRGEAVRLDPGWLPVKGQDFGRVLRAFVKAGADMLSHHLMSWWRQPTPKIAVYDEELYVMLPVTTYTDYPQLLVRLDDGELGTRFTEGVEMLDVDDGVVAALRAENYPQAEKAGELFRVMRPIDYLKLVFRVREYSLRIMQEYGYPIQTFNPYIEEGTAHAVVLKVESGDKVGYMPGRLEADLSPYDPSYSYVSTLSRSVEPLFDPGLDRLSGMELLTTVTSLTASGRRLYQEEGSGVYALNTQASEEELQKIMGSKNYRVLREVIMPRLGDELYLVTIGATLFRLYSEACPPPEYVATMLMGKALLLEGEFLRPWEEVEGRLPEYLLTIESGYNRTPGGWFGYHLALRPKPLKVRDGIYLDGETGAGVVVTHPESWDR